MSGAGWGSGAWGTAPWGGGPGTMTLIGAVASRENQVQLEFSRPIYFSGVLDAADASMISKYSIAPVAGTVGLDGSACRPVRIVDVELETSGPSQPGLIVNLNLDRPMTPYAGSYRVTVTGIFSADLSEMLIPDPSEVVFFGVFKNIDQPQLGTPTPIRDIANVQTFQGALASGVPQPELLTLGTLAYDDTGDYAFDERVTSFKKRMLRRIISTPGGFMHLGMGYGVGIKNFGKRLASAANRGTLAAQIEKQIAQEPETARVRANIVESNRPGLYRLQLLVKLRSGLTSRYELPFPLQ